MGFFSEVSLVLDQFSYLPPIVCDYDDLIYDYGKYWYIDGMDLYYMDELEFVKFVPEWK